MLRVLKRDKGIQAFSLPKVQRALLMAFTASGETTPDVSPLVQAVSRRLALEEDPIPVVRIQEIIENVLMSSGFPDTARRFIRYRHARDLAREKRLSPDNGAISEFTHVGKYARYLELKGRRELKLETVGRLKRMHLKKFPELEEAINWAFGFVEREEVLPSMRSMQFGGPAMERDNERGYNCSFCLVDNIRRFQEIFYLLLCGCGVGFSVQWRHVEKLPAIIRINKKKVVHHTIDDNIKGWADAIGALIYEYTVGGRWIEYNYSSIRAEGTPLSTSGGRAPGHIPLRDCLEAVRSILDAASGRKLRPIECHDIICYIAQAVLAGGIRRSALISIFSPTDTEMLYAKTIGKFRPSSGGDPGLNAQREMANNSAALLRGSTDKEVFDRIIRVAQENYGDPGFFWTNDLDYGCNPCGEIGLNPVIRGWQVREVLGEGCPEWVNDHTIYTGIGFCNLTEINCATLTSSQDLLDRAYAASLIGTLQAAYTDFPYLGPITEAICRREALLGVSLTGIQDNRELVLNPGLLREAASVVVETNSRYAIQLGINPAARLTTIKPSGTASLWLGGISSGIHYRWSRRMLRGFTENPNNPVAQFFRLYNPHMVEEKPNGDWFIQFPLEASDEAKTTKDGDAQSFLEDVFTVYLNWVVPGNARPESSPGLSHNVSCTVTVRDGEIDSVLKTIWERQDSISAMSFAPYLLDKRFAYAPWQESDNDDHWNYLIRNYRPVPWDKFREEYDSTTKTAACEGNRCIIE